MLSQIQIQILTRKSSVFHHTTLSAPIDVKGPVSLPTPHSRSARSLKSDVLSSRLHPLKKRQQHLQSPLDILLRRIMEFRVPYYPRRQGPFLVHTLCSLSSHPFETMFIYEYLRLHFDEGEKLIAGNSRAMQHIFRPALFFSSRKLRTGLVPKLITTFNSHHESWDQWPTADAMGRWVCQHNEVKGLWLEGSHHPIPWELLIFYTSVMKNKNSRCKSPEFLVFCRLQLCF